MLKQTYILLFYLVSICCFSQKDSSSGRWPNLNHFVGIDFGYSGYDKIADYKGEVNLNYVFNPQYFMVKAQFGVAPFTNFGTLKKGFISMGFSTKSNKAISWHMLTGVGIISPTKSPVVLLYDNLYYNTFTFYSRTFYFETGIYIKPIKSKKWIYGINFQLYKASIANIQSNYVGRLVNAIIPNINFNINYKLNK